MPARMTRPISWISAARKEFDKFPVEARDIIFDALTLAADGGMAGISKPLKGLGSGIFEVALKHRGNAFRTVYAVQLHEDLWVIHAFQKKATHGIKTPKRETDLVKDRLKRLKETLR
jgi:phage-related protein